MAQGYKIRLYEALEFDFIIPYVCSCPSTHCNCIITFHYYITPEHARVLCVFSFELVISLYACPSFYHAIATFHYHNTSEPARDRELLAHSHFSAHWSLHKHYVIVIRHLWFPYVHVRVFTHCSISLPHYIGTCTSYKRILILVLIVQTLCYRVPAVSEHSLMLLSSLS